METIDSTVESQHQEEVDWSTESQHDTESPEHPPAQREQHDKGGDKEGTMSDQKPCEKKPLPHQKSFHNVHVLNKEWGKVNTEENKRTDSFQRIVQNSIYGNGSIFCKAALVDHTGTIQARHPEDFLPSVDQIKLLNEALTSPGVLALNGIRLAEKKFTYHRSEQSGAGRAAVYNLYGQYCGEDGKGGCMIFPTKHYMLIGVYHAKPEDCGTKLEKLRLDAYNLIGDVCEWLTDTGM